MKPFYEMGRILSLDKCAEIAAYYNNGEHFCEKYLNRGIDVTTYLTRRFGTRRISLSLTNFSSRFDLFSI